MTNFSNMFALSDINASGTTTNYDNAIMRIAAITAQDSRTLSGGLARFGYAGLGSAVLGTGRAHLTAALDATPILGHAWTSPIAALQGGPSAALADLSLPAQLIDRTSVALFYNPMEHFPPA